MTNKKLYNLLFEAENKETDSPEAPLKLADNTSLKTRKSSQSVDYQIDALILRYETDSIRDSSDIEDLEEHSLLMKNLKFLLEQEEPEAAAEEEPADSGVEDDTSPTGSEEGTAEEPAEKEDYVIPDLDIDDFTRKCVRLISNFKSLLRIDEVIVNRIKNHLDENYGDEFVIRFIETLRDEYGIEANQFDEDEFEEVANDVFAVGAYAGGTGGGGS